MGESTPLMIHRNRGSMLTTPKRDMDNMVNLILTMVCSMETNSSRVDRDQCRVDRDLCRVRDKCKDKCRVDRDKCRVDRVQCRDLDKCRVVQDQCRVAQDKWALPKVLA